MACWKWTSTGTWSHRLLKTGLFPRMAWPILINSVKGSNGWLLKGKNMEERLRPKTLWQVSSTQQIRNHKRFTWSKNLSKAWMTMFQGKHLISQPLVWKRLMITRSNIPWANQKASGIPRLRWGSWCQSMKNSWNLKEMAMVKELLHLVSFTAVLIWSNPSLLNLQRY